MSLHPLKSVLFIVFRAQPYMYTRIGTSSLQLVHTYIEPQDFCRVCLRVEGLGGLGFSGLGLECGV